jgi:hypothetical protein
VSPDPTKGAYAELNARSAPPAAVARDFVKPAAYDQLIKTTAPQLLVGPRGIGKTTLLKMLVPEALDAWTTSDGEQARGRVGFTGVFVQADKIWAGQYDRMTGPVGIASERHGREATSGIRYRHRKRFGLAAFAFVALAAFADVADYRARRGSPAAGFGRVQLTRTQEEQLAESVAASWLAHPATSSLGGLAQQMRHNLSHLSQLMKKAGNPSLGEEAFARIVGDELLDVDFHSAAVEFIDAFNRIAGEREARWVLLVDEFEFIPPAARFQIAELFQGGDSRLSYKVSLAPYTGTETFAGSDLHDWHKVELTHRSTDGFSVELLSRELEAIGLPEKVLKGYGFGGPRRVTFAKGSRNARDIRRLAELDVNFRRWLERTLGGRPLEAIRRDDPRYRKLQRAMPLVRLRLQHRERRGSREHDEQPARVSRLYAGARNAYLLTEGNPRWIKALAHELRKRHRGGAEISEAKQAEAISQVARRIYSTIGSAPIEQRSGLEQDEESTVKPTTPAELALTPVVVLDQLGEYLHTQTHERAFSVEVVSMFRSKNNDPWLDAVLNSLIFLGALVVEPQEPGATHARIRLAHMWSPLFELLVVKGRERPLTRALNRSPLEIGQGVRTPPAVGHSEGTAADRALVTDRKRRVSVRPWRTRTLNELAADELAADDRYDAVLASVGYEPRSFAVAEKLAPLTKRRVAVEFAAQRTQSYDVSLEKFRAADFEVRQDWDDAFMPFLLDWLHELAASARPTRVAVDVSSMNRKRIAAVVEVLAALRPMDTLTADILYAPALFNPPAGLPHGIVTLAPVSSYFAGELQAGASAVALLGMGYEPEKAVGALTNLEVACAGVYVPTSPNRRVKPAVIEANRAVLEGAEAHGRFDCYEILDPLDCIKRLDGHSRMLLAADHAPMIIPLGPKIFALSSCIVAAMHYPEIQVWRASFDADEEAIERVADGMVCGVTVELAPA